MSQNVRDLTLASVNLDDADERAALNHQDLRQAGERIREAVHRQQRKGIIDAEGRLLRTELPPDMQEGAARDFGG